MKNKKTIRQKKNNIPIIKLTLTRTPGGDELFISEAITSPVGFEILTANVTTDIEISTEAITSKCLLAICISSDYMFILINISDIGLKGVF